VEAPLARSGPARWGRWQACCEHRPRGLPWSLFYGASSRIMRSRHVGVDSGRSLDGAPPPGDDAGTADGAGDAIAEGSPYTGEVLLERYDQGTETAYLIEAAFYPSTDAHLIDRCGSATLTIPASLLGNLALDVAELLLGRATVSMAHPSNAEVEIVPVAQSYWGVQVVQ
jgi:hypothetical protein